jgi:excisionase family DNA binding protein
MSEQITTPIENERLLKAMDVAMILNISRALSYRLMESGMIPSIRINRVVRVKPSDLKRFIESQRFS